MRQLKVNSRLIRGLAMVKKAACLANAESGYLSADKASAIAAACDEIIAGKLAGQFPVDALQGGAGTSTNMNLNEVIANRAIELQGGNKGDYRGFTDGCNYRWVTGQYSPLACFTRLKGL